MESEDYLEFSFPNLSPLQGCGMDHPYIYILTRERKYENVFPTLRHLAYYFGLQSCYYNPRDYLMRAWWTDNRDYFVPHDLVFDFGEDRNNAVLELEKVPEHFMERNLECFKVEHFWHLEKLRTQGLPFMHFVSDYVDPPELIPKIGWVDEHHPLHSKCKP